MNGTVTISSLLQAVADGMGLSSEQYQILDDRYNDLGQWLREHASQAPRDLRVYIQGSVRIGTTNSNPTTGVFDADAVLRVDYRKDNITQLKLNQLTGGWLGGYVSARQRDGHPLAPSQLEKKLRAWTLSYDGKFHMDVLPVVPEAWVPHDAARDPSWLTDRQLRNWQPTDPRGFASWFDGISKTERQIRLAAKAAQRQVDVDSLPANTAKTTLQYMVQLLKKHRDQHFGADPDDLAPPSIVLTTLAGRAYAAWTPGGGELSAVMASVVTHMPDHLEHRNGVLWIPNPTNAKENFADRFNHRPEKEKALRSWLECVARDLGEIGDGLDRSAAIIDRAFGPGFGQSVVANLGRQLQSARERGRLGSTASGGLAVGMGTRPHREHRFYGEASP